MASLEEPEQRTAAMEAEPIVVRQEAAADRDTAEHRAELSGHTRALSALRKTQLEHYGKHKADASEIKSGLAQIIRLLEGLSGPDCPGFAPPRAGSRHAVEALAAYLNFADQRCKLPSQ
ncbi:hypothetical protein HH310_16770 [Actinoplanes sp. TBRC 11911]|uniref:hypothetical protein n=1 Tax=Actinoplanes sp. TBRC 11911 TaxID=2729386 RepID=UPI00145CE4FA|nr:hypothetical protein [Actinoplanes sp. TBRC 11911]NMO52838.1 hypothetical protein [Actinoplanes sp. TBRC 11911]